MYRRLEVTSNRRRLLLLSFRRLLVASNLRYIDSFTLALVSHCIKNESEIIGFFIFEILLFMFKIRKKPEANVSLAKI